jgi:hypothetical protein
MPADVESSILRCVQNYRSGAICESIFYACLIELAGTCPPERLWTALPPDVRDGLENAVMREMEWAQLEGLTETQGYRSLQEWLPARDPEGRKP